MRKILVFLLSVALMSGCASVGHLDRLMTENRQNILKLQIGMTKQEALDVMGNRSATEVYFRNLTGSDQLTVNNPYKSEILQGKDGKTLEILYYYIEKKRVDNIITDDSLTPLVFDNGKLIGWGWGFLQDNINKYEIRIR